MIVALQHDRMPRSAAIISTHVTRTIKYTPQDIFVIVSLSSHSLENFGFINAELTSDH